MIVAAAAVLDVDDLDGCVVFDVIATVDLDDVAFVGPGGLNDEREKAGFGGMLFYETVIICIVVVL